ncbi:MAG: purine-binding chemotaxis protein CheW [Chloroflexi bacterium]|nr:purine-binding chemotaxis protein CheW [Chloroflexota bacterium]
MAEAEVNGNAKRKSINWAAVHRRMEAAAVALTQGGVSSPEAKREILRSRARSLARETEKEGMPGERLEVIEFLLAGERYAVEASYVREVYPLRELVSIPGTPAFVLGITSVRGKILSVIDIKKLFDLPEKGLTELDKIIVLQANGMEFGMHADAVVGMRPIALEDIQSPLPTLTGIRERYLRGITGDQVAVLDMGKLFSDKSLIVHEEVEI